MKTLPRKLTILITLIVICIAMVLFYVNNIYDIGYSSKKFITRDFNNIFNYRVSGNCDEFGKYINQDYAKDWFERCLEEKGRNSVDPIKSFTITSVSSTGNQAFVQAELERYYRFDDKYEKYPANYELRKESKKWFLFLPKTQYIINQGLQ